MENGKVEKLAEELFLTAVAPSDEDHSEHYIQVFKIARELTLHERQRATKIAKALLAENQSIQRAQLRLDPESFR